MALAALEHSGSAAQRKRGCGPLTDDSPLLRVSRTKAELG
jgi:hypothetical protein